MQGLLLADSVIIVECSGGMGESPRKSGRNLQMISRKIDLPKVSKIKTKTKTKQDDRNAGGYKCPFNKNWSPEKRAAKRPPIGKPKL